MLFELLHAVEIRNGPTGDHKVVVFHAADRCFDALRGGVDVAYFPQAEVKIVLAVEKLAEREDDGIGLQPGCSHLVEQRLKRVVVLFIKEYNLRF